MLLSKCDKLPRLERVARLRATRTQLASVAPEAHILLFSSQSGEGVDDARALLDRWLRAAREE